MNGKFLVLPGALCAALTGRVTYAQTAPETERPRPNIIYIMSDDHAVQAISAYGHPLSRVAPTPNIDRIATEGIRFDRAYCGNSISGPSRAAILTGKHSHKNGFMRNDRPFDGDQQTLPKILAANGYSTAIIGKWHLNSYPQGFDYWKILDDQGMYYNPDFIVMGDTIRQRGYVTDIVTDESIEWIDQHREQPFFIMVHNKAPHRNWQPAPRHLNLHEHTFFPYPSTLSDNYSGRLAAQRQEMSIAEDLMPAYDLKLFTRRNDGWDRAKDWGPDYRFMDSTQLAAYISSYDAANRAYYDNPPTGDSLTRWKYQRYMRDYFSTVEAVDEGVGRILDYLDSTGMAENTIVVYASDQSFYLGEHGWFDKRFMYEESMRMPLLIRYPAEIQARTVAGKTLVQNIDFAPTLLDYCGITVPVDMQGVSFRAIADGGDRAVKSGKGWRKSLYYRYYENPGIHNVMQHAGVHDGRWKLIYFYSNEVPRPAEHFFELYDLKTDPMEMTNRYGSSDGASKKATKRLMGELRRLAVQYGDSLPMCPELE